MDMNCTLGYMRTETKCMLLGIGKEEVTSGFHSLGIREAYVRKPRRAVPGLGRRVPCSTQGRLAKQLDWGHLRSCRIVQYKRNSKTLFFPPGIRRRV